MSGREDGDAVSRWEGGHGVTVYAMNTGSAGELDRNEKTVATATGDSIFIHLWEDRTRGELWVPAYDSTTLALLSDDFLQTASGNAVESGRRSFEFQAIKPGTHRLVFEKRLGWKFTSEDRRVFLVEVTDEVRGPRRS